MKFSPRLHRTEVTLSDSAALIPADGRGNSNIESYLTQYILIVLYAETEAELRKISSTRAAHCEDAKLATYATNTFPRTLKSMTIEELKKFVRLFGNDAKQRFSDGLGKMAEGKKELYGSFIESRHTVAHGGTVSISFKQLPEVIETARHVIQAVFDALSEDSNQR